MCFYSGDKTSQREMSTERRFQRVNGKASKRLTSGCLYHQGLEGDMKSFMGMKGNSLLELKKSLISSKHRFVEQAKAQ